jgi:uncharacterized protein involved in exopolysaccharide biosynthesis/MinD-like ATPase involved in chromosome partitioning or flagellar assembly
MNYNGEQSIKSDIKEFSFSAQLQKYWQNKRLFLYSILACLLISILYLYLKPPLYRIQSTLVIKDEKKGESISTTLKELDFLDEQKIVDNEAEIIRSENSIARVVEILNLNIGYYRKDNFLKKTPLFIESPISIKVLKTSPELYEEELILKVINTKFQFKGKEYNYNDTLQYNNAAWIVSKTDNSTIVPATIVVIITNPGEATQQLRSSLATSVPTKNSSVLNISMLYPSREKGELILTKIIEVYQKSNTEEKRRQTDSIVALIEDRLTLIGRQVRSMELKESTLKTDQRITFLDEDARSLLEQSKLMEKEFAETTAKLQSINGIKEYIENTATIIAPSTIDNYDLVFSNMIKELYLLELEKQRLSRVSGIEHPAYLSITQQIESLRKSLFENISLQQNSLTTRIAQLKNDLSNTNKMLGKIPNNERQLLASLREKKTLENVYAYLLEKREEASLSDAAIFSKIRWVDKPYSAIKPAKPKKLYIIAMAIAAGLLIPVIILGARDGANKGRQLHALKENPHFAVIGTIPKMTKFHYRAYERPGNLVSEQFRWTRTVLEKKLFHDLNSPKVVMVSSLFPKEGKDFVSLNLAASFGQHGLRTVLVDLDFRKNKISEIFNLKDNSFTEELQKTAPEFKHLLHKPEPERNFFILADNKQVSDISDIFNKARFDQLFAYLKANFDCIIINTAPIIYVADAYQLEHFSDLNIFVLRQESSSDDSIEMLRSLLKTSGIKVPYIILNDVPKENFMRETNKDDIGEYIQYV